MVSSATLNRIKQASSGTFFTRKGKSDVTARTLILRSSTGFRIYPSMESKDPDTMVMHARGLGLDKLSVLVPKISTGKKHGMKNQILQLLKNEYVRVDKNPPETA